MSKQLIEPNLDPYIYVNGQPLTDWYGWCLAYAECAFGTARLYATAHDAWLNTQYPHKDQNLPSGVWVLIWFDHFGDYGQGYKNYGHVALYKDGTIYSSPVSHKPYADTWTSIAQVEKNYSCKFVGWSEDIAGSKVAEITESGGSTVAETISLDTDRILQHGILGRNGLKGRAYALDGSTGDLFKGQPLTNANIQAWYLSDEARAWRDSNEPASVNGINAQLDSIAGKDATIASQTATIADLNLQLTGKQAEIADLQDDVANLKTENEALKKALADAQQPIPPTPSTDQVVITKDSLWTTFIKFINKIRGV